VRGGKGERRGKEMERKGERASHIAAALGLAKPRAGPVRNASYR